MERLPGAGAYEGLLYTNNNFTPSRLRSLADTLASALYINVIDARYLIEQDEKACKMAILDVRRGISPEHVISTYGFAKWLR